VPKKAPTEYLKQMYFDSVVFEREALRHLTAEVGASRVVLGSDQPYPWADAPVEHVLNTPGLTDQEREGILGATAAQLLGLPIAPA
jgi:aminocarboxymuconate-semialdehyde decarboxylase